MHSANCIHQLPTAFLTAKQLVLSSNYSPYNFRLPSFPKGFFSPKPQWHQPSMAGTAKAQNKTEETVLLFYQEHFYRSGAHFHRLHPNSQRSSKIQCRKETRLVYDKWYEKNKEQGKFSSCLKVSGAGIWPGVGSWNVYLRSDEAAAYVRK